jgi:hypothetical protein
MAVNKTKYLRLPAIDGFAVDQLTAWLREKGQIQRPPAATAKVLVLACKLFEKSLPFPTRDQVAKHLGVSVPTVDVVLSQRQASGDIKIVRQLVNGNVQQRPSTITLRLVILSEEITTLVKDAENRSRRARTRPPQSKRRAAG